MSLEYYLIRAAHLNKNTLHLTSLFNLLNQQAAENIKPTSRKPKIIGDFAQSDVNVDDRPHFYGFKSKFRIQKFSREPHTNLRCWVIFDHLNKRIADLSLYGNEPIYEVGYPCLTIGESDGLYGRNLATILNRGDDITEYYRIPHNDSINYGHTDFSNGFSIMLIFKPYSFKQQNGVDQTVYQKINDSTVTGGVSVRYDPEGRLKIFVRSASTNYNFITEKYKIRQWAYNTVIFRYDPLATPRIACQIQKEAMTDDIDETPVWSTDPANTDAYFGIGNNLNSGKAWIALQEFRQANEVWTSTQMKSLFANKLTIDPNLYGETAWVGYTRFHDPNVATFGFDSSTYDSVGFDTS
jgi:hypothetical protein